jgi:hypothetical protein
VLSYVIWNNLDSLRIKSLPVKIQTGKRHSTDFPNLKQSIRDSFLFMARGSFRLTDKTSEEISQAKKIREVDLSDG